MIHPIIGEEKVSLRAGEAAEVAVNCRAFLIKNNSDSAKVYFGEALGGEAVTIDTGFPLAAGESYSVPLCAHTLSLVASADADVRLLYIGEGW